MSSDDAIRALLAEAELAAQSCRGHDEQRAADPRRAARAAWVRETADKWHTAQRQMDERCCEVVGTMDGEARSHAGVHGEHCSAFERFCDAEQAKVDVFYKPLRAVIDHDKWPRELYWGGV